ncbi:hypothetical protein MMC12_004379 [Toensbergia leucococca]|nr:hypothetical protein [Toensbergia leucococca]
MPDIVFSSEKGSLYNRRKSKSPARVPELPAPPKSDPRVYWFDGDPPSYELDFNKFSVFKALLNHPELIFETAKHLDVEDLISLYAISKDFHFLVNGRFTALILAQSLGKASESSKMFRFKCFKNLCIHDPASRPNEDIEGQIRFVPSFRWLRMILFREKVVDGIIECLAAEGHRLPKRASLVLKKIWFTMDISDNARRIGFMHNKVYWEDKDLFIATMFFLKLDMRLTDPISGGGENNIRKMLLAQRTLSTLWKVLNREMLLNQLDVWRMFVRWRYQPPRHHGMSILGVPAQEVGKGIIEGWGSGSQKILRPDELVMREGIRRNLNLHTKFLDMMIWGYVDKYTFEDIWVTAPPTEENELTEGSETAESGDSDENGSNEGEGIDYATLDLD